MSRGTEHHVAAAPHSTKKLVTYLNFTGHRLRRREERVRERECLLGRKTRELEILKETLDLSRVKKPTLLS